MKLLGRLWQRSWRQSRSLTATTVLMLVALAFTLPGLAFDHRVITGAPAWLKPAKFALSTAILTGTLAWIYGFTTVTKTLRRSANVLSAMLILEDAIIFLQAARGTSSHFNLSTSLDGALYGVMGVAIAVLWTSMIAIATAFFRQGFTNVALGWAFRLGMTISVVGAATGGLMVQPTPAQIAAAHGAAMPFRGGHTVGAPDGGPGLPGTGWSTQHGDLRAPHFLGLHGLQAIPIVAWLIMRRVRSKRRAASLVFTAAASYLLLTAILIWQALRGESIAHPTAVTLVALGVWAVLTGLATAVQTRTTYRIASAAGAAI